MPGTGGDPGTDDEEGWDMATDYDAPRKTDDDLSEDPSRS